MHMVYVFCRGPSARSVSIVRTEKAPSMVDSAPPSRLASVLTAPQDAACDRLSRRWAGHPPSTSARAAVRPAPVPTELQGLRAQKKMFKDDEACGQVQQAGDAPPRAGVVPASLTYEDVLATSRTATTPSGILLQCRAQWLVCR